MPRLPKIQPNFKEIGPRQRDYLVFIYYDEYRKYL